MAKRGSKIKVSFVGENATEVTGSCIWIQTPTKQILLECGLWQSAGDTLKAYKINSKHFKFDAKAIDYVFVNHCHIDHCGKLPLLYQRGSNAKLIMPDGSREVTEILLMDSAHIAEADAEELSQKYGREYHPLYSDDDVTAAMNHLSEFPMGDTVELDENIKFRFVPSGHIVNSAQLELWITDGNITKKFIYTSDLGNVHINRHFSNKMQRLTKADYVIGESTYGGEVRVANQKTRDKDLEKLYATIKSVCQEHRGKVLIPIFANNRGQEMLTVLYEMFSDDPEFNIPILFDTPLGIRICDVYDNILSGAELDVWKRARDWDKVIYIKDAAESRAWQADSSPAIILSSSGMMTHGRSRTWCKQLLPSSNNAIVFCGFAVENSLAAIIKEGKVKRITLGGKRVNNRCQIVDLHSFSSHAQRDTLIDYYSSIDCEKIFLVHGDMDGKLSLSRDIEEELSRRDKTAKVICVNQDYQISV